MTTKPWSAPHPAETSLTLHTHLHTPDLKAKWAGLAPSPHPFHQTSHLSACCHTRTHVPSHPTAQADLKSKWLSPDPSSALATLVLRVLEEEVRAALCALYYDEKDWLRMLLTWCSKDRGCAKLGRQACALEGLWLAIHYRLGPPL